MTGIDSIYEAITVCLLLTQAIMLCWIVMHMAHGLDHNHRTLKILTTAFITSLVVADIMRLWTIWTMNLSNNWILMGTRGVTVITLIGILTVLHRDQR